MQITRPALVMSRKTKGEDIIVVAITSRKSTPSIEIDARSLQQGALPLTSFVRYDKVVTLHESLVKRIVACVKPTVMQNIIKEFKTLF